ncbi:MAG: glycoside hydrolase family 3 protein [Chlamydiae bacterium]|nr:glycoside hydrolase family 3 protein [Chlamydiota bacterium]MBI3277380.1 glycoside hydrolase family 3 protein [Chlamydiota bacterium]
MKRLDCSIRNPQSAIQNAFVGRHLVIGIQGTSLDSGLEIFLKKICPAGIILFSRNIVSLRQLKKFISDLREVLGDVFFVIDHEGGVVHRFSEEEPQAHLHVTHFPGNLDLGRTQGVNGAYQQGQVMAQELISLGVDVNFAPMVDVLTPASSSVSNLRFLGEDPALVSKLGGALIRGMQGKGLAATAKHFPGLGGATLDPHDDLPLIHFSLDEMEQVHLKPFRRAIKNDVAFIMTTHLHCLHWDSDYPVTLSKKIVHDFLREKYAFHNVIISDDLEMGAMTRRFSLEESVVGAIEAGHDLVIIGHHSDLIERGYEALSRAYQSGRLKEENLRQSSLRIKSVLEKLRVERK